MENTEVREMVTGEGGYTIPKEDLVRVKESLEANNDARLLSPGDFYIAYKFGLLKGLIPNWKPVETKNPEVFKNKAEIALRKSEKSSRNEKIITLYNEGKKLKDIAAEFSLSPMRVRGILLQAGVLKKKEKENV